MSKKNRYLTLDKNFDKWLEWLNKTCSKAELETLHSRVLRSAAMAGIEEAHDKTPKRTGRLQNSIQFGAPESYFKLKIGKASYVVYGTTVQYAAAVEEGFTQKAGRFVPGEWRSGTFHYIPGHKTGMVLTGKVIEGAHMFEKSMMKIEELLPELMKHELKRLYDELFR